MVLAVGESLVVLLCAVCNHCCCSQVTERCFYGISSPRAEFATLTD